MQSLSEIINLLNSTDECATLEAKRGTAIGHSVLESICAFANEPGLGGGTIILGVTRDESSLFPVYQIEGIKDPDKLQADLASQTASLFNQPIRPQIELETTPNNKLVLKIKVPELPDGQKPLYFKNEGLPKGAYRRIGSTDQHCTEDDLFVFYNKEDSLDSTIVNDTSLEDISEEAITLYRNLRSKVNEYAEELTYSDIDLLRSLGCIKKHKDDYKLTYTGLLVFGNRMALRRLMPMVRVDYIRVPGNTWVENPDSRFTTVDMRGPMIQLVQRIFSAIADDLPKGFLLPEGELQATNIGLPSKVLREAIVNALIHRTYRENQPIQIIRYGNRLEIKNPGFSLKPEEQLGEPGSKNRNPFIASIFHETNLAETKGSGIRIMRSLMEKSSLAPPTFESNHTANQFTTRLLLHHFLSEADIAWLKTFEVYQLNDAQKRALIFVRETGAIDNQAYRQLNGCDILKASTELRAMRDVALLQQKGKGRATYYIIDSGFNAPLTSLSTPVSVLSASVNTQPNTLNTEPQSLLHEFPDHLQSEIAQITVREKDINKIKNLIYKICKHRSCSVREIAALIKRKENTVLRNYIIPMKEDNKLQYTIPDMPNHPDQAYQSI
ncbi:ATP-binding protein [Pedobacter puniceum]|uniref:AAA family ATPase n=1 Tax=Pedobacter puniceum TaxID=2666136 RepID=A0A7K0FN13_9SPHI|nr:ATP-binding protein [Pedobacter puniceum]MRX46407.1 AAA family ATPase [Pedobacter puniceum]